LVQKVQFET